MKFEYTFSAEQLEKLNAWEKEQDLEWVKSQELPHPFNPSEPYYGAIGGSLSYTFTPTGVGMIVVVKHANGAELDVTDYDEW